MPIPEHKPVDLIDRTALLKKLQKERDAYVHEHFTMDPETGTLEASNDCEEYLRTLDEQIEGIELFPAFPQPQWSRELPNETGLWWWWNEDEDSLPIPVFITYSGTSKSYFAMPGQHGWNTFQEVAEMGGRWMRLHEPATPSL